MEAASLMSAQNIMIEKYISRRIYRLISIVDKPQTVAPCAQQQGRLL
jgi:hypothetical protein